MIINCDLDAKLRHQTHDSSLEAPHPKGESFGIFKRVIEEPRFTDTRNTAMAKKTRKREMFHIFSVLKYLQKLQNLNVKSKLDKLS